MPRAVQRQRTHPLGVARRQVQADRPAERDAGHVRPLDADRGHECGHLVGVGVGRVRAGRLVALARARQVDRDAAEVLGVGGQLERVAGVIGAQVGDEQERLAVALHVVVDAESVDVGLRHTPILFESHERELDFAPRRVERAAIAAARLERQQGPLARQAATVAGE